MRNGEIRKWETEFYGNAVYEHHVIVKMAVSAQYSCLALMQFALLFIDLLINSFGFLAAVYNVIALLVISLLQGVVVLALIVTLFLGFFNTSLFTVGLLRVVMKKFMWTLLIGAAYLLLTIALHATVLAINWDNTTSTLQWIPSVQTLYIFHKLLAVVFYYVYKRAVYRLSDKKLYNHSLWIRSH